MLTPIRHSKSMSLRCKLKIWRHLQSWSNGDLGNWFTGQIKTWGLRNLADHLDLVFFFFFFLEWFSKELFVNSRNEWHWHIDSFLAVLLSDFKVVLSTTPPRPFVTIYLIIVRASHRLAHCLYIFWSSTDRNEAVRAERVRMRLPFRPAERYKYNCHVYCLVHCRAINTPKFKDVFSGLPHRIKHFEILKKGMMGMYVEWSKVNKKCRTWKSMPAKEGKSFSEKKLSCQNSLTLVQWPKFPHIFSKFPDL